MTTFMDSPQFYFTSESVTEGHPDKLCDQISDAILDALLDQDPNSRVACETATTTGMILVMGEVTTKGYADIPRIVRDTVTDVGYTRAKYGFDAETCNVIVSIKEQSKDIAQGVDEALEHKTGEMTDAEVEALGAGDQGMMIGFACDETPELMPLTISLANGLTRRLSQMRRTKVLPWLRPDGKAQVTVEYHHGKPVRVDTVVVSTQHAPHVTHEEIEREIIEHVIKPVVPAHLLDARTKFYINPTGRFVIGGPMGDAGLTGRKIIVDTYGGMARHGGGAFSGKDPSKVDRSAAYAMRWVAKNIVAAGLAGRAEVQVAYAIGKAEPVGLFVETFGTETVPASRIQAAVGEVFDLRPAAIIRDLDLKRPIYAQTASYGHFGRELPDFTWERANRVEALKAAIG